MTLPRYAKKRYLEPAGFVFLSGWVRNEDAPPIREALRKGEEQAAAAIEKAPARLGAREVYNPKGNPDNDHITGQAGQ
jgi:hypothetical protein